MNLTPIEQRTMTFLKTSWRAKNGVRCSELGPELFGRGRGSSSNPHSRAAGKILHGLMRKGLVRREFERNGCVWRAR